MENFNLREYISNNPLKEGFIRDYKDEVLRVIKDSEGDIADDITNLIDLAVDLPYNDFDILYQAIKKLDLNKNPNILIGDIIELYADISVPYESELGEAQKILKKYFRVKKSISNNPLKEDEEVEEALFGGELAPTWFVLTGVIILMSPILFAMGITIDPDLKLIGWIKNLWGDFRVKQIIKKLKSDPEVIEFAKSKNSKSKAGWRKLLKSKISDKDQKYITSISKEYFRVKKSISNNPLKEDFEDGLYSRILRLHEEFINKLKDPDKVQRYREITGSENEDDSFYDELESLKEKEEELESMDEMDEYYGDVEEIYNEIYFGLVKNLQQAYTLINR